jgi:hypothetical protein
MKLAPRGAGGEPARPADVHDAPVPEPDEVLDRRRDPRMRRS